MQTVRQTEYKYSDSEYECNMIAIFTETFPPQLRISRRICKGIEGPREKNDGDNTKSIYKLKKISHH